MLENVGHTGVAHAGLMLAAALDRAAPGDRIAVISVSDGVDAVLLRATDALKHWTNPAPVQQQLESKRNDLVYTRYLRWRNLLEFEPPRRPDPDRPAPPPVQRSHDWKFAFAGSECTACGTRHLPPQRVRVHCQAVDQMKEVPLHDERAHIATFTVDRLAFTPQPPMVSAIADFPGSGRIEIEVTDCEPVHVQIGAEVEMTFRRLYTAGGIHNYFWKARPVRRESSHGE